MHPTNDDGRLAAAEEELTGVLTLTEGLEEQEFRRSRLTREEVRRLTLSVSAALGEVGQDGRSAIPELDWVAWATTAIQIGRGGEREDNALWLVVCSLAPATLTWLRVRRRSVG